MTEPKSLTVLGATGSIGDSVADVVAANPQAFDVTTLVANGSVDKLASRAREMGAKRAVVADEACYNDLKAALSGTDISVASGRDALLEAASTPTDLIVCAMVGAIGIEPAMAALEAGNTIALANKEALVCAGPVMTALAAKRGVRILPLDSEHSALFQVFEERNSDEIEAITLTASGGPFRTWTRDAIAKATLQDALNHPNWSMGPKVTIDSATLANKGLEVIEAHHLFAFAPDKIKVLVHPQSIIHGMVHYTDGSVLAQLGAPDMRSPIAAALAWPGRYAVPPVPRLDLADLAQLTFEAPDMDRFPMLGHAFDALKEGGAMPAIFNAANEVAVSAFVDGRIAFHEIATIVAMTMDRAASDSGLRSFVTLEDVLIADQLGQRLAKAVCTHTLPA
ncbi:MAG: 1-deoxy-D-xylulose-5-phosphate reductoisomerase [Cohaesibacteraceae bacterium]